MPRAVRLLVCMSVVLPAAAFAQRTSPQPIVGSELFNQLKYRHIGPEGNRVSAVTGVIGDPNVYYAGAASGGIFKRAPLGADLRQYAGLVDRRAGGGSLGSERLPMGMEVKISGTRGQKP